MEIDRSAAPVWGRGSLPGELFARWPKMADGTPEEPVYLCHCKGTDMDDTVFINRMESYGIPCLRQYPNDGRFGKLILGISGTGVDIFVPASLWADACELCKEPTETEDAE